MPHALSITDGTTTISLSTAGVMLVRYIPDPPQFDGRTKAYKAVTESVDLLFYDVTATAVQAKVEAVERVLRKALERATTGRGPKVYLLYKLSSDADFWRSEVQDYRLQLDADTSQGLPQGKVTAKLLLTRLPYWEGPRTQIPLSNTNGSGTAALRVCNCNDGSGSPPNDRVNYADIAAGVVTGVLPAPLELRLTNTMGTGVSYSTFFIANNPFSTTHAHVIEGETPVSGFGTSLSGDSSCSGSGYGRVTAGAGGIVKLRYNVPKATLNAFAGRLCKVLARFRELPGRREVRLQLWDWSGLSHLGAPSPVMVTDYGDEGQLHDLGTVQLPPGEYAPNWRGVQLEIQLSALGAETFDLDFLQLTPAEPSTYRRVQQRGFLVAANEVVVDDGIEGRIYSVETDGEVYGGLWIALTEPLHVFPAVAQRLTFLHDTSSIVQVPITNHFGVQAFYRPRRLTL